MTVLTVVLMFALFILFYFPARQESYLLENYNEEVENFAKTVALGVKIALTEQNFEGVETAIDFVRHDERLVFVSIIQVDSSQAGGIDKKVFKTFPDSIQVNPDENSSDAFIIKRAPFSTPIMTGEILLSFSTEEIVKSRNQIRLTSLIVSLIVFVVGLIIGFWLARNISKPVLALRDAANKVGEGDLTQSVESRSRDEIGELSTAFNKMVKDLNLEAILERVRTRAMAMRVSGDLETVMSKGANEFHQVVSSIFCGIGIIGKDEKTLEVFSNSNIDDGNVRKSAIEITSHPFFKTIFRSWKSGESASYELSGDDLLSFLKLARETNFVFPELLLEEIPSFYKQFCYVASFPDGVLFVMRNTPFEGNEMQVMQRFANAFYITYSRWKELVHVEQRVVAEQRQASLDRVRGEIASMRTKSDLQRITPLIWKELKALNVPFFRCGVFIVDDSGKSVQSFLTNSEGIALGVFSLFYHDNDTARKIIDHWTKHESYYDHWDKTYFLKFMHSLIKKGYVKDEQTYQGSSNPPESLHLHFTPFKQGMLYVGNTFELSSDSLEIVKSLAETFSMAYARYEDFNQLEEAKLKVESTLEELKSTQSQLIHAEKMASLGELTAGIAHEIQNPLNFVNNFSEVTIDLLEEMAEEMKAKNDDEVKLISEDIKSNLDKISYHGKRASSIVKGMLEHSRTSKREKDPTDINALADEYLRLAYHGLRAKDKSFNAEFKTEFDDSIPRINVITLDIGRVLLNLINNAFYAVSVRAKREPDGYQPMVVVSTKGYKDRVEIRVKDNADGIPPDVLDKIFQPFYTTKPTGQGTGLGLSISFDIVTVGHNGEIKIDTSVGKGTEFIIELPINV